MNQVEELFTIDIEGSNDFMLLNELGSKETQSDLLNEVNIDGINGDGNSEDFNKLRSKNEVIKDNITNGNDLIKLNNTKLIEEIKNMKDEELENMISIELWTLYKEIGTSVWPSFLRYENPPQYIKMLESRFYLNRKSKESNKCIIFPDIKDSDNNRRDGINNENDSNYLEHINHILRELSKNHTYKSILFNDEKNTKIGLITLYLITNGIRKSNLYNRCQFCGSSRCDRKATICRSNRCFKCLLKGHQIKDCKTKYGQFNQNYLLPIRIDRESIFRIENNNSLFDEKNNKTFEYTSEYSKHCICFNCDQIGHINCSNNVPMLSGNIESMDSYINDLKDRFLIYPEDINSLNQQSRNLYLKNNILLKSNRLFNISYLIDFVKHESIDKKQFSRKFQTQYTQNRTPYLNQQYSNQSNLNLHLNQHRRQQHQHQYHYHNSSQYRYQNQNSNQHHFSTYRNVTTGLTSHEYHTNYGPNFQLRKRKKFNDGFTIK